MQQFTRGAKVKVALLAPSLECEINLTLSPLAGCDLDVSCFGIDKAGQLSDEGYFIFFNQLSSPEGAIVKQTASVADSFLINLKKLPEKIDKLIFAVAIDGPLSMKDLKMGQLHFLEKGVEVASYTFFGADFQNEKAIIVAELYRKNREWRFSIVGQGFNGGLSALLAHFGGTEEAAPEPTPKVSLTKNEQVQKIVLEKAPRLVDLTKKVGVTLEKKRLTDVVAKVLLVLDVSGSMSKQYRTGRVQRILDKALPLALQMDDNHSLESWAFASRFRQLDDATMENVDGYINQTNGGWQKWDIGGSNNEPAVMEAIFLKHKESKVPVYVIFISDGGVSQNKKIKEIITTAAYAPIFWQFIGISGKNYGALEKLDELRGRYIDNANFFALDDIDEISDQALYDRMMHEFPDWLEKAKEKHIL